MLPLLHHGSDPGGLPYTSPTQLRRVPGPPYVPRTCPSSPSDRPFTKRESARIRPRQAPRAGRAKPLPLTSPAATRPRGGPLRSSLVALLSASRELFLAPISLADRGWVKGALMPHSRCAARAPITSIGRRLPSGSTWRSERRALDRWGLSARLAAIELALAFVTSAPRHLVRASLARPDKAPPTAAGSPR